MLPYFLNFLIRKNKKKKKYLNLVLVIFILFFIVSIAAIPAAAVLANNALNYYTSDMPDISALLRWNAPETTKILSRNGNILYEPHGDEVRTKISIEKLPEHLKNAFIAVEDKRFWQHSGIDTTRILSSAIHNAENPENLQGGSTITQQLVRNCLLNNEKTLKRKIQEAMLAALLEKNTSKEKILELYLNQIPFGSNIYGVEAASQRFWGKSASDLGLAESAILASLPKATTYFSPYENQEALFERQKIVLKLLLDQSLISQEEFLKAKEEKITFNNPSSTIVYPHFTMYALDELEKELGKEAIENGGLKIITTIDEKYQQIAEEALKNNLPKIKKLGADDIGLVAIDTRNGQVLAMVGSADFWDKNGGQYNAALAYRQPGSTFKPLVYVSAFDTEKFTPDSIILDSFVNFNGYKPHNFDWAYHGEIKIRYALANSYNIPTVKTLNAIGLDYFRQKMAQIDIIIKPDTGLPAALGAEAVPLVKMAAGYASFANYGNYNPPAPIISVANKNGEIFKKTDPKNIPVFSKESAKMITSILSDYDARVSTFGSSRHRLELSDRRVAAKTGTTDDRRDAWTIGYTPSLACGVWVGNRDNSPMGKKAEGVTAAAPIWKEFMEKAVKGMPKEEFEEWEPGLKN